VSKSFLPFQIRRRRIELRVSLLEYPVLRLRSNLSIKVPTADLKGGMGISFQFRRPKDAQACNRPQRGQRSVDRSATIPADQHKECPSLWVHFSWGCFIICKIMVSFDVAPFGPSSTLSSDRRELMAEGRTVSLSNGRSTTSGQMVANLKRDPHAPRVIEPARNYGSYF
jgi:hypothetical protein